MIFDTEKSANKRLFTTYIYYRLVMGTLLTILFAFDLGEPFLDTQNPTALLYIGCSYILFCLISVIQMVLNKLGTQSEHIILILLVDFIALIPIINSSTSVSGLSYLLLIPMAIGGTFLRGKTSVALASFAAILLITSSAFNILYQNRGNELLFTAGITATALFIAAIAFRLFSKKIEQSEEQIEKQSRRAEYLQNISQQIIETMQSGIAVIDKNYDVLLINNAAETLLESNINPTKLNNIPEVRTALHAWKNNQPIPESVTVKNNANSIIKIHFTNLPDKESIMLLIEDEVLIHQKAQQFKLASLGRLTSSIAHEIRNPLGAISHASQLLDESESIQPGDQDLLRMITVNSQRIDQTISNILQFSRRKESSQKMINLCEWIIKFKSNYQAHKSSSIHTAFQKSSIYGRIDPNHLQQIITNLVDNGLRHSGKSGAMNIIKLSVNIDSVHNLPSIDIEDEGDGINDKHLKNIFEPFFTTKTQGSGLGLYLCKELCDANLVDIIYLQKTELQKSCFRLTFNNTTQKPVSNEK